MVSKTVGFIFHLLIIVFLITTNSCGAQSSKKITNVGVIVDFGSLIATEQRLAMEVSAQTINNNSDNGHELLLNFQDSKRDLLISASIAEEMIKEKKAEVILVLDSWEEAALVGKIGNRTQIPVISLASPSIAPPQMQIRWPFLVTTASDASSEISCIADLICAYKWRKIVLIYEEDDEYSDYGSRASSLLSEALENIGVEIEYRLNLPPYSLLSDPKGIVLDELAKLLGVQSRAFVILRASMPMLSHLFGGAKNLGLMERDSVWIVTESITDLLDYVDNSVVTLMKGTLGIKTHYSKASTSYKDFKRRFGQASPGFQALRAYDTVRVISQAVEKTAGNTSGKTLLKNIVSTTFNGLSGEISFRQGRLVNSPILKIVNVVGGDEVYKELDYWKADSGFFESLESEEAKIGKRSACKGLTGTVVWPGSLYKDTNPKGWSMPSIKKPLIIGVPSKTQFKKFVTVDKSKKDLDESYDGLCIQVFRMALKHFDYDLSYKFIDFNGTYDELVEAVYNKTFDAAVGDITILAERLKKVEFTLPYLESGLSMITPIMAKESSSIFFMPFTWEVWALICAFLVYTMIVVWFLEHPTNPEFRGTLTNQIGTTLWFTFSSLFFAQREKIHSNVTKVAVIVWFVLVFIMTASYTANLSSMLTVRQLQPEKTIQWLKSTNQKIGCDTDSFIKTYLQHGLGFKKENIFHVPNEYDYVDWFAKKNITAAFLEQPYEKVLLNQNCNKFTVAKKTYKFGGLGFVFQKGSPIARDMSEAILKLSENGNITKLEKECLAPNECSQNNLNNGDTNRLSIKSFQGIFLISGITSTICFLISLIRLQQNFRRMQNMDEEQDQSSSVTTKVIELAKYFYKGEAAYISPLPRKVSASTSTSSPDSPKLGEWRSSRWEFVSTSDVQDHDSDDISPPPEVQITVQTTNT